jgi:hypothetical protein
MSEDQLHDKIAALEGELEKLRAEMAKLAEADVEAAHSSDAQDDEGAPAGAGKYEREIAAAVNAGKRVLHELDNTATRYPVGSLVVAFTVGLVISRLFGGRRGH